MTEVGASLRRRLFWKYVRIAGLLSILSLVCLAWWVTTESFQTMVRTRLITELEAITGGRVELGSIHTTPFLLRVEARGLTVHGKEARDEVPYAHVDRIIARVKIISVLGAEFGFHSLILDHPVLHIIVYPDGTTNQPLPRLRKLSGKTAIEQLFRLSITRLEVRRGEVRWNNQSWPLDFEANDISADMTYSLLHRRYESNLLLGKIVTQFRDSRPVAWMMEAHFGLGSNSILVTSLRATSGRTHVQAHGRLADFRHPEIEAAYDVTVDLGEAAAVARWPEVDHGAVDLHGNAVWSPQHFALGGKLSARDFDWHDKLLNLNNVTLNAQYSVTPQQLLLSSMQAHLLGGTVAGEAEITGWPGGPQPEQAVNIQPGKTQPGRTRFGKTRTAEEQKGNLRLRLKDISLGALATALSNRDWPLQKANPAGVTNGSADLRWKGSVTNSETEVALDFTAPASTPPGAMPLNGNLRATYHAAGEELDVAELNAASRTSQVHASGKLSTSGALKISASTSNLSEWQTVLAASGNPVRIPAELHGRATFNGSASGKISDITLAGNVRAEDFDYLAPALGRKPAQPVHWDLLTAEVQLSRHNFAAHNGTLRHGNAAISFDVAGAFDHGQFTNRSAFSARIDAHNADLSEVLSLTGYGYPATGTANLSMQVSGTSLQPHGSGHWQLTNATIYGEPVQSLSSDLRFQNGEVQATDISILYDHAKVTGAAGYNFTSHSFQFDLKGENFDLARVPGLRTARLQVTGQAGFAAHGSGTVAEPAVDATIEVRDLTVDRESYGSLTLQAVSHGTDLHLSGHSLFEQSELSLDGNIHLQGNLPSVLDLKFNHLDVDALLKSYSRGHVTGHSVIAGDLHVEGPLLEPSRLALTAKLNELNVNVENVQLHNQQPVQFSISNQILKLELFRLVGENTDFSGSGSIQLTRDRKIDVHAQGEINLKLIQSFNSDFNSSGTVTVNMAVSGTVAQPVTQGRLEVSHAGIAYTGLPSALSDINGTLLFNQNRFQIESLTAHTGGGLVTFGGYATWFNRQLTFDLSLQERGVRLRYPPGVSSTADADLHFVGSTEASTLSGDITINRLAVTPGFDFGAYLIRSSRAPALPQTNPLLNRIRLDVHVVTAPELQMQTAVVRLSGEADLRVRGTAAKPVLMGRADVLEGQVYFNGTKYQLERGEVAFTNPVTTTPVLDLQATTQVRDYDITLTLSGEPSKLKVSYRSEPPLPEADIITLVALGRTTQESAQLQQPGQTSFTQDASSAIINQALNTTVANRAQRLFGVSRIKIDPQGLSTETNLGRGPLVTIEQQVANNVTLTYSTSVEQASQQIIQLEVNLSRNVSIVGIRDQNGVVSFDVRIRRRKK